MKQVATRLLVCVCLWLTTSAMHTASAQTHVEDESLLKAAFIFNFAKFTRWPENTWEEQHSPLKLCTAGKDVLVNKLEQLAGKMIKQHPVMVQPLKNVQNLKNCHLLYIATSEEKRYKDILNSMQDKPILTISEIPHFGRSGGIIELYNQKGQTHFIINLDIARETGLVISSRLLNLAEVINSGASQ